MKKQFSTTNVAIIITSIGEKYLNDCMESIKKQNCKIGQIIVSIPNQTKVLNVPKNVLLLRSKYKNQVYQRSLAKKYLKKKIKIIFQLDCKFILNKNTINELVHLWNNQEQNVAGIGIIPTNYFLPKVTFFQKLLNLNSDKIGKVLKSGNVSAWGRNLKIAKVEWLHGGCVSWKLKFCKDLFNRRYPLIDWSVAEDLIYSYRKFKKYEIKITNEVKIKFKKIPSKSNLRLSFRRSFLHAKVIKNFVKHEKNLSIIFYYYSMLFSSFLGIIYSVITLNPEKISIFFGRFLGSVSKTYNYKII